MVYRGISSQEREFTLKLSPKCDVSKITAAANDGILRIELPMKAEQEIASTRIPIAINEMPEQKKLDTI
jgi:HSP20 family molecular chaperone IbpA